MKDKKLSGGSLAGSSKAGKVENEFYATNPQSIREFLDIHKLEGESFYEPCCGQGHISKVLEEYFPNALHLSTDLVDRGYGFGEVDFLTINTSRKFDWIITNPPFSLATEFVDKSLSVTNKGVVMFLKIQFLESVARKEWLQKSPLKYVYQFSKRQAVFRDGQELDPKTGKKWANTIPFAMFVWQHGYCGEPKIRWI